MKGRNQKLTFDLLEELVIRLSARASIESPEFTDFYRTIEFEDALGTTIQLTHFPNLSRVTIAGGTQINFTHFSIDGFWPNRFKENLNLSMDDSDTDAIIPLKTYE